MDVPISPSINLNGYDFTILSGVSSKTKKPYKVAKLDSRLAFNEGFIHLLEEMGAPTFMLRNQENQAPEKASKDIGFSNSAD